MAECQKLNIFVLICLSIYFIAVFRSSRSAQLSEQLREKIGQIAKVAQSTVDKGPDYEQDVLQQVVQVKACIDQILYLLDGRTLRGVLKQKQRRPNEEISQKQQQWGPIASTKEAYIKYFYVPSSNLSQSLPPLIMNLQIKQGSYIDSTFSDFNQAYKLEKSLLTKSSLDSQFDSLELWLNAATNVTVPQSVFHRPFYNTRGNGLKQLQKLMKLTLRIPKPQSPTIDTTADLRISLFMKPEIVQEKEVSKTMNFISSNLLTQGVSIVPEITFFLFFLAFFYLSVHFLGKLFQQLRAGRQQDLIPTLSLGLKTAFDGITFVNCLGCFLVRATTQDYCYNSCFSILYNPRDAMLLIFTMFSFVLYIGQYGLFTRILGGNANSNCLWMYIGIYWTQKFFIESQFGHIFSLVFLSIIFIPQIVVNVLMKKRPNLNKSPWLKLLYCYLLGFAYLRLFPWNYMELQPLYQSTLGGITLTVILLLLFLIWGQYRWGPFFFLPKFMRPQVFDYRYQLPSEDGHIGVLAVQQLVEQHNSEDRQLDKELDGNLPPPINNQTVDVCPICLASLKDDVSGLIANSQFNPDFKLMKTPCTHRYHSICLMEWMSNKMECPICRVNLPPFQ